jgi:hypothetical protein
VPNHQGDIFCKVIEWEDALADTPYQILLPLKYALDAPHPNPFNSTTILSYQLPNQSPVHLTVWDIAGRLVKTLVDENQSAGQHQLVFDGSYLTSGIYLVRMQAGNFQAVRKIVLLK